MYCVISHACYTIICYLSLCKGRKMDKQAMLLKALRDLLQAVERCEDNEFSVASKQNLAAVANAAADVSVKFPHDAGQATA